MNLDRVKEGTEIQRAFHVDAGPCFALWLECLLESHYVWHLGVAFRSEGETDLTRVDQIDTGLRVGRGIEAGSRWWILLPSDRSSRWPIQLAVERLRRLAEHRAPLPFGCFYAGGSIDGRGRYRPAPGESGLSCASLIVALFEGVSWPLIDRSSWAGRTLPEAIADAVERELEAGERERFVRDHGVLVLPSEVAGACLFELPRVPLADARRGAAHFEELARQRAHATSS